MKSVFTVQLIGQLDQITIVDYNKTIMDLIDNNIDPFVMLLEMSQVEYMNSTAIGYLADWYNTFSQKWWDIVIVWAQENIEDTLEIVGLASRIKLFPTIDSFKEDFIKSQTQI